MKNKKIESIAQLLIFYEEQIRNYENDISYTKEEIKTIEGKIKEDEIGALASAATFFLTLGFSAFGINLCMNSKETHLNLLREKERKLENLQEKLWEYKIKKEKLEKKIFE